METEQVEKAYELRQEGKSWNETAEALGVHPEILLYFTREKYEKTGHPVWVDTVAPIHDKEWAEKHYINQNYTIEEIASMLRLNRGYVQRKLNQDHNLRKKAN